MHNFEFSNPTKIIFGRNTHELVGETVKIYAKKVLLHYGGQSIKKSGLYDKIIRSLKEAHIDYVELGGVKPNPRLSLVQEGVAICKAQQIDFILAVGGGSVIDSSKAIAMGSCYEGDVWDFYATERQPEAALSVGVVLTIAAAGSESSEGSVITKDEEELKLSCSSPLEYPKFAILNPELCYTLPEKQIFAGGTDMFAHVMERYFTQEEHTDLSDRLCEATMKTIIENMLRLEKDTTDYNAWAEIMWAGTFAHNGLLGKGRVEDWASHEIEHELSAIYDIAHGVGLAIVFPAWAKYVYKANINRFVQFAIRVFGVDMTYTNPEAIAIEGIKRMEAFFVSIHMPVRLAEVGIDSSEFELMAKKACRRGSVGSFKELRWEDVNEIFKLAE